MSHNTPKLSLSHELRQTCQPVILSTCQLAHLLHARCFVPNKIVQHYRLLLLRSAWRSQQTFLFLFCFFFLRSADKVGRPFCFCSVSYYYFFSSFLFFFTATCEPRFLRHFSTDLDDIWHVDSPWWGEQTEYFFKSIGPGVGIRRGPKVLLCFIIGKTLYTVRRDKNFT